MTYLTHNISTKCKCSDSASPVPQLGPINVVQSLLLDICEVPEVVHGPPVLLGGSVVGVGLAAMQR